MSTTGGTKKHVQRLDIQGLRMVAVVAVMADHIIGWPHGGFIGVDVFFVISGFLITDLLLREVDKTGRISFLGFYQRRAKRILPAATLVLFTTVLASFTLLGWARTKGVIKDSIASALFAGNWHFAEAGVDYFQEGRPPSPVQHYWSLAVEEQFYFVWPWLMLGLVVLGSRSTRWRAEHARLVAGAAITVAVVASFAWAMHETATNPTYAYFSTFSRTWELGLGALVAVLGSRLAIASRGGRAALQWLGLAGIVASVFVVSEGSGFPAPWAALPVLSTCLVIAGGIGGAAGEGPVVLTNPVSRYLGDISYSLYLWHFPVAILGLAVFAEGSIVYVLAGVGLTLALAAATYRWLEQPARRGDWFQWSPTRRHPVGLARGWIKVTAAAVGIAAVAAVSVPVVAAAAPAKAPVPEVVAAGAEPTEDARCFGAAARVEADCPANPDAGVAPLPENLAEDQGIAYQCYINDGQPLRSCEYGVPDGTGLDVAVVGDSHAASLLPGLALQADELGWTIDTYIGRGCRLTEDYPNSVSCEDVRPQIVEEIMNGDYDLVIATGTRQTVAPADAHVPVFTELVDAGIDVVVVEDNPRAAPEAIACVLRIGYDHDRDCQTPASVALSAEDPQVVAAREVGLPVVDVSDIYCWDGECPSVIGSTIVYRDASGHISATWARTVAPYIVEQIPAEYLAE